MTNVVDFNSKSFREDLESYPFDAEAYSATYHRVQEAIGGEPLPRAMSVLANLLVMGALMPPNIKPENAKEFLTSLISELIDAKGKNRQVSHD